MSKANKKEAEDVDDEPISRELRNEIIRARKEILANPALGSSWEEVKARMEKRYEKTKGDLAQ